MFQKYRRQDPLLMSACAIAACIALGDAHAQTAQSDSIVVTGKRINRISSGATGLAMEIKDTPQSISTVDQQELADFGITGSIDALRLGTGINVEQYETNRAVFNSRGFEVQFTQVDGLGLSNSWGTVVGQMDTFLFERVEFIRGANGLLTGMGNASGTINYVRKRPTNKDEGQVQVTAGSYGQRRIAADYNKRLTEDGSWAGRLVVAHEDKDSHLRDLHDRRSTVYGVVDGQIGDRGVLTAGFTFQRDKQQSPMWGSLTLRRADGSQAEFDDSASTSQKWTYWNTLTQSAFVEYAHDLGNGWEAKLTYNYRHGEEDTKLLYAYSDSGTLNDDNTGLKGWPYRGYTTTIASALDAKVNGPFKAFGRTHDLLLGLTHSRSRSATALYAAPADQMYLPLPAFPYGGDVYPEPTWGARTPDSNGEQELTRFYVASRWSLTDRLTGILGANAVHFERKGSTLYGDTAPAPSPDLDEVSPYVGITYDVTPDVMAYASYSDIFQVQEQKDRGGNFLDPVKGVNAEVGLKAEWLDKKLLTTAALFTAEQKGLATYAGTLPGQISYYEAKDVKSKGLELEATGRISLNTRMTVGYTHLKLTGPDGNDIYEWVPRNTFNLRFDTRLPIVPGLRLGANARWQSDAYKAGGATQGGYLLANAFAAYELNDTTTVRLNVNNLFDKKYIGGLAYGAIYGAPRNAALTVEFKL
ncbi:TonB-dependent siderophore receptor [Aquincola sp. MAHUQ-54]|uniref:TonB-dependent siderophore receptor n=1 Tax=Aquincola agrisoli TaxID=3119538 RepID=A0AAW9QM07_9BURK